MSNGTTGSSQTGHATLQGDGNVAINTLQCPSENIVLIPRKAKNIFADDKSVRMLLPDRYPARGNFIKDIEYNFYPDLNVKRTITAVVTEVCWSPEIERRPAPRASIPVYFSLGGTAKATLSANQATTDAEGCASVDVTIPTLLNDKDALKAASTVEVFASLTTSCQAGSPSVKLTIHRNEDVDAALAPAEAPGDFAATLAPVLNLSTWIVRQKTKLVTSNGAKAVQQLLNQVACRKLSGGHKFCKPDGQFGPGGAEEAGRFIQDFSGKPAAGDAPTVSYRRQRFAVTVEDDDTTNRGVKRYVRAEYGSYTEGDVIDAHLLVGPATWTRGAGSNVMAADGLLDIYTAVVWEFLETMRLRADEYRNLNTNWYRHPNDNGGTPNWPAAVTQGESYWFGGARKLEDFQADLAANFATPPNQAQSWYQYLNNDNCRIGLHGAGDQVDIPANDYSTYAHLNTDGDISNAGSVKNPHWVLHHPYIDRVKRQYTGIDCSGFCHRVAMEAAFRPAHCLDLANQPICPRLPQITHANGLAQGRLTTSSWPSHYRLMGAPTWRREISFRGDLINVPGHHIVMLETADRSLLTGQPAAAADIQIFQANGETQVATAVQAIWPQTECVRRVVYSPLAQWGTAWTAWNGNGAGVQFGRIYLWD